MFTSNNKKAGRAVLGYVSCAAFTAFFGFVYEQFSHEVYSPYMMFAFLIPLIGGLPAIILRRHPAFAPAWLPRFCWRSGVAILTVGSLMKGVLDIYGTTNRLLIVYPVAAIPLLVTAAVSLFGFRKEDRSEKPSL